MMLCSSLKGMPLPPEVIYSPNRANAKVTFPDHCTVCEKKRDTWERENKVVLFQTGMCFCDLRCWKRWCKGNKKKGSFAKLVRKVGGKLF